MMTKKDLINKRVRHNCENPDCPLKGKIIGVKKMLDATRRGSVHMLWVLVQWDAYKDISKGYAQYVPLKRVKLISEDKKQRVIDG